MGKYMKRVFIIIAVLCVVFGLAGTIADSKETAQMTGMKLLIKLALAEQPMSIKQKIIGSIDL